MGFELKKLRLMADSVPCLWSYRTEDTATQVKMRHYFDAARDILSVGDWLFVTSSTGGTILHVEEIDPLELSEPK
jgi:hypothetical protein